MKTKTFSDAAGRTCALLSLLAMLSMLGPIPAYGADGRLRLASLGGEESAALATEIGAGEVGVLYGTAGGLSAASSQAWHQDSPGMEGIAEANDRLGAALAAGDFNGDGYVDLAVGVVNEEVGGVSGAGAVNVLYGSAAGLVADGNPFWHQDSPGMAGEAEPGAAFGFSLAAGDFNGDGYADLAVGVPGQEIAGMVYAGAVNVLYGSPAGLTAAGNQYWHQGSPDIEGEAGLYDTFGYALAAGDFNGDGYADLAVGVPGESVGGLSGAGAVNVLYGSANGLSAAGDQAWHQDSPDILDAAERGDLFGSSLAAGDLDGDGYADLAVGVPSEAVGSVMGAGAVSVIYGSADGLSAHGPQGGGNQFWHQDNVGAGVVAAANDGFGRALCIGDLDGDGYADLMVGVPGKEMQAVKRAGAVNVLYGSAGGLIAVGSQIWHQDSPDIVGTAEEGDSFGAALAAGDLNGDGYADLAVGVPLKGGEGAPAAGAANVLYGSAGGLSAAGNQAWRQGQAGLAGTADKNDFFGSALATDDLDGDGAADLVIGVPGQARYRAHLPAVIR